jgi:hypothetical protein
MGNDTTESAAELMAFHRLDMKFSRAQVEQHLGRPPTADEIDQLARGVDPDIIKSAAALPGQSGRTATT